MPAGTVDADPHLPGESPLPYLPIESSAGKTGAGEHGLETDDSFNAGHGLTLPYSVVSDAPRHRIESPGIECKSAKKVPMHF